MLSVFLIIALCACSAGKSSNNADNGANSENSADATDSVEKNGDIIVLYTSDVHCGIDQGFGYAGLYEIKKSFEEKGYEVLLVDNGDTIQGEPIGTMTRGEAIIDIMNEMDYDVAIPGNHEFDYGMDHFLGLVDKANFQFISCNFEHEGELVFKPYIIKEVAGKSIAFVGVTTPMTLITSTPANFKNEAGEFVYGFKQDQTGEKLYAAVQEAVDAARAEGADYVYVLGHMGNDPVCKPYTFEDVISHTNGVDVFIDGHSHDTKQLIVPNKDGDGVPRTACGTKMQNIGYSIIKSDGTIETGLISWNNGSFSVIDLFNFDNKAAKAVAKAKSELDEKLNEVVAKTSVDLITHDPTAVDENNEPLRIIRNMETNLGDFVADAYRVQAGADIALVNGGGIRAAISAGDITHADLLSVHPFGNSLCVVEATGQQIVDALEWASRAVPGELGGFLQVSGITFEIHSYIESGCVADDESMFVKVVGERRVKNVKVNGEPIDLNNTYSVASHNYMLFENGDGFTMFDGCKVLQNKVKLDNQVLIDYIMESLGGVVGDEYKEPYGQGRIVIVETKP